MLYVGVCCGFQSLLCGGVGVENDGNVVVVASVFLPPSQIKFSLHYFVLESIACICDCVCFRAWSSRRGCCECKHIYESFGPRWLWRISHLVLETGPRCTCEMKFSNAGKDGARWCIGQPALWCGSGKL